MFLLYFFLFSLYVWDPLTPTFSPRKKSNILFSEISTFETSKVPDLKPLPNFSRLKRYQNSNIVDNFVACDIFFSLFKFLPTSSELPYIIFGGFTKDKRTKMGWKYSKLSPTYELRNPDTFRVARKGAYSTTTRFEGLTRSGTFIFRKRKPHTEINYRLRC